MQLRVTWEYDVGLCKHCVELCREAIVIATCLISGLSELPTLS